MLASANTFEQNADAFFLDIWSVTRLSKKILISSR